MTEKLRSFNEQGIAEFQKYIKARAANPAAPLPAALLTRPELTDVAGLTAEVEGKSFSNRLEMAEYLHSRLSKIRGIEQEKGVWAWLALFYFNQLCPPGKKALREYRYIPEYDDRLRYYRHLVLSPYLIYAKHGAMGRLFLCNPLHKSGDVVEQFIGNQQIFSSHALVEVLDRLYYSSRRKHYKKGVQGKTTPGNMRRIPDMVKQFGLTYDLADMTTADILDLLPGEFDAWKLTE